MQKGECSRCGAKSMICNVLVGYLFCTNPLCADKKAPLPSTTIGGYAKSYLNHKPYLCDKCKDGSNAGDGQGSSAAGTGNRSGRDLFGRYANALAAKEKSSQ